MGNPEGVAGLDSWWEREGYRPKWSPDFRSLVHFASHTLKHPFASTSTHTHHIYKTSQQEISSILKCRYLNKIPLTEGSGLLDRVK